MTLLALELDAIFGEDEDDEYYQFEEIEGSEDWEIWEEDPYPALRAALGPEYRHLPADAVAELVESIGLSPEDVEFDLGGALRSVGRVAASVAPTILPIAGTAIGTAFGGPLGGALGGTLGQLAGGAIGSAAGPRPRPRPPIAPGSVAGLALPAALPGAPAGTSPAAATLLQLLSRPEVLQGLMAMAMGSVGARAVPVGGTPVPPAAFANLLGTLATRAAAEAHASGAAEEGVPSYLLGADGEALVDTTLPEERAGRLLGLLAAADQAEQQEVWT